MLDGNILLSMSSEFNICSIIFLVIITSPELVRVIGVLYIIWINYLHLNFETISQCESNKLVQMCF